MKNLFLLFSAILLISCSQKDSAKETSVDSLSSVDTETVFSLDVTSLPLGCENPSELVCTINLTVKCILNPDFEECEKNKDRLPDFVFMKDETLQRPTFQSYKITKIRPREDGFIEVHTQSSCNGSWFGLCSGNIIYVMKNSDSKWIVTDIYATEF